MSATAEVAEPDKSALELKDVFTVAEAAAYVGTSADAVRDWLTLGVAINTDEGRKRIALAGRKVGGHWRVKRTDLENFVNATTKASLSPDALTEVAKTETPAQYKRRSAQDKAHALKRLGG